ncbi:hypothetical protein NQ314_007466 [Rhamnusium bicolor]|uniref:FAD-binding PCMH-type domain-containing protein n=1 Tax=Rhamnusium bicolor TaxID=1586634 RepID=A0AAV8YNH6_9CUCU|nr:hypothetical protein NQ314_007466 [Rhamnusium bicolor]
MLLAGNTSKGIYRTPAPDIYIDVTSVDELTTYSLNGNSLVLGANLTLTKIMDIFTSISQENVNFAYLSSIAKHIDLVANVPVRNIGTIAGNLMIKYNHNEFQSDIFLLLETYDATIVLVDIQGNEIGIGPREFLNIDMDKRLIKNIVFSGLDSSYKYLSYKIMARAQSTRAVVNAGFLLQFSGTTVQSARIVYGAINPEFVHATNTETYLVGKNLFDNNVLSQALDVLDGELIPDYVPPDPTPEYRKSLAISLFYKFVLNIAPDGVVSNRNKSGGSLLVRPVSRGIQQFSPDIEYSPVGEPIVKVEALTQTSGQAEYIDDIPDFPNQLYASFVTAKAVPNSVIVQIDATRALALEGVVAFYGVNDIPGENSFIPTGTWLSMHEELFCSGIVKYYDQPIGIVVADNNRLAEQAADLVDVIYSTPVRRPYLNIKDVLDANDQTRIHHLQTVVPKSKGTDIKHVIKGTFDIGWQYHFHMEVQCANVVPTEDTLDLYPATQWMDLNQQAASAALNIPMHKINVYVRRLGGGFGGKITRPALVSTAAALAAHKLNRPVKMWMPLQKNMSVIGKRIPLWMQYEVGVNDQGVIQYLEADLYSDVGVGGNETPSVTALFENCYNTSTWSFSTYSVNTDTHANCSARAPAASINVDASDVKLANMDQGYPLIEEFWDDMQTWGDISARKADIETYNQAIQVCAYKLGIEMEMVSVRPSYNVATPNSNPSGGSATSEGVCLGVIQACDVLLERMKGIREKMVNPTWADSSTDAPSAPLQYKIYGLCATEVEVDILTGQHQILRVDIIEDTGESMNPLIDIGQCEGAFVMGIGYYTTEEIIFNEDGQILTNRTWNYLPPGAKDIPINFNIKFPSNNPNPIGILKSKAIAEPPVCMSCSVPLAIRNAVSYARQEADSTQPKWYPFTGPSTVENTHLNSLNNYKQYVL